MRKWDNGAGRTVGEVEVDISPFVSKLDGKLKIVFAKCEYPNTSAEIEFKVVETAENHGVGDESNDEESKESLYSK